MTSVEGYLQNTKSSLVLAANTLRSLFISWPPACSCVAMDIHVLQIRLCSICAWNTRGASAIPRHIPMFSSLSRWQFAFAILCPAIESWRKTAVIYVAWSLGWVCLGGGLSECRGAVAGWRGRGSSECVTRVWARPAFFLLPQPLCPFWVTAFHWNCHRMINDLIPFAHKPHMEVQSQNFIKL